MYNDLLRLCVRMAALALLMLIALPVQAQVNMQVAVVGGQASGKTSDWVGQFRKNRVLVTIINPTINTYEIAFRTNVPYVDEMIINQTQWIWGAAYELPRTEGRYV